MDIINHDLTSKVLLALNPDKIEDTGILEKQFSIVQKMFPSKTRKNEKAKRTVIERSKNMTNTLIKKAKNTTKTLGTAANSLRKRIYKTRKEKEAIQAKKEKDEATKARKEEIDAIRRTERRI